MEHWFPLLMHWIVSGVALAIAAALTPGFRVRGFGTALVAVLLIGAANYFIYPLMFWLTLPISILTLGLFVFVLDAVILRMCSAFMKNFEITNWFSAIIGAILLSLTSNVLHFILI